jgi:hypothetical protein
MRRRRGLGNATTGDRTSALRMLVCSPCGECSDKSQLTTGEGSEGSVQCIDVFMQFWRAESRLQLWALVAHTASVAGVVLCRSWI